MTVKVMDDPEADVVATAKAAHDDPSWKPPLAANQSAVLDGVDFANPHSDLPDPCLLSPGGPVQVFTSDTRAAVWAGSTGELAKLRIVLIDALWPGRKIEDYPSSAEIIAAVRQLKATLEATIGINRYLRATMKQMSQDYVSLGKALIMLDELKAIDLQNFFLAGEVGSKITAAVRDTKARVAQVELMLGKM